MRGHAGIGAEHDRHAGLVRARKGILDERPDGRRLGTHEFRKKAVDFGLFGNPVAGQNRRDIVGAILLHQPHDFVVHVGTVLDRCHACDDRALHALGAVRMRCNAHAVIARRLDNGAQLLFRKLRVLPALGDAQNAAGRGDLDPVRAVLVALAHGFAGIVDTIDHAFLRSRITHDVAGPAVGWISVTPGRTEPFRRGDNQRSRDITVVDSFAQCDRDIEAIAQVPDDGKAGFQRPFRILCGIERVIRFVRDKTAQPAVL